MNSFQRKIIVFVVYGILGKMGRKCLFDNNEDDFLCLTIVPSTLGFNLLKDSEKLATIEKKSIKWLVHHESNTGMIEVKQFANHLSGYDYNSSSYFTLRISDGLIKLYDNQSDDFHYYSFEKQLL